MPTLPPSRPPTTAAAPQSPVRTAPAVETVAKSAYPGEAVLRFQRDPLAFLRWLDGHGGDAVRVRLGATEALLLRDPDLVAEVLLAPPGRWAKGPQIQFVARVFGTGLLTSEPPHHTRARRLVLPAFAHGRLAGYAETIVALAERAAQAWAAAGTAELVDAAAQLTYDIAEQTLFGAGGFDRGADVRADVAEALSTFAQIARNPILVALSEFVPVPAARRLDRVRERVCAVIGEAVDARRAAAARGDGVGDDLLGMLLVAADEETGEGLTDAEVIDEALTILLAGHETTASALAWTWLAMDRHPEAQATVDAETAALAGPLSMASLAGLSGTRGVLAEAMRLHPPAYLLDRTATQAVFLGGLRVARRTTILMSPYLIHRDARFWDDPEAFRPDRPELRPKGAAHRCAYIPFSMGTRGCIGERFAWMEGTLVLAAVARHARLRPLGPWPDPLLSLTLRPATEVSVRVEQR